ncbi:hypothetical protein GGD83_002910 [Rhodoblastus sphagnicola]|nr:hypothetical protein [Rhodoblastus sphagnicola]
MISPDRFLLLVFCLAPWAVAAAVIFGALMLERRARSRSPRSR